MISIHGTWYDGRTSSPVQAECRFYDNGEIRVIAQSRGEILASRSSFDILVSSRLADTPRHLSFPDGEKFETGDNHAVDQVLVRFKPSVWANFVHRMETRLPYVALALVLMAAFIWGGARYGVPVLAQVIAQRLPYSVCRAAGRQTLAVFDRSLMGPTGLDQTAQARIKDHFKAIVDDLPDIPLHIIFRKGRLLGPNAFALPDGTILFTDEMVETAEHDDELAAVLAHEIGHVVHRHGMRRVVQDSLLGFALLAVTGDASGSSELFLGIPVMLTELAYSREFEREADRYALQTLRAHNISPSHFVRLMRRIEKKSAKNSRTKGGRWSSYLSTHPAMNDRLDAFEHAGR